MSSYFSVQPDTFMVAAELVDDLSGVTDTRKKTLLAEVAI